MLARLIDLGRYRAAVRLGLTCREHAAELAQLLATHVPSRLLAICGALVHQYALPVDMDAVPDPAATRWLDAHPDRVCQLLAFHVLERPLHGPVVSAVARDVDSSVDTDQLTTLDLVTVLVRARTRSSRAFKFLLNVACMTIFGWNNSSRVLPGRVDFTPAWLHVMAHGTLPTSCRDGGEAYCAAQYLAHPLAAGCSWYVTHVHSPTLARLTALVAAAAPVRRYNVRVDSVPMSFEYLPTRETLVVTAETSVIAHIHGASIFWTPAALALHASGMTLRDRLVGQLTAPVPALVVQPALVQRHERQRVVVPAKRIKLCYADPAPTPCVEIAHYE